MAMNRIQFQPGLSMPAFLKRYGTVVSVRGGLGARALADRVSLSALRWGRLQQGARTNPSAFSVPSLSASDLADRGHRDAAQQTGPERLVSRDLPCQPGQDRAVCAHADATPWGELSHGLADPPQVDACDGPTQGALCPRRPGTGR